MTERNKDMAKSKLIKANKKIEKTVTGAYRRIEKTVTDGYTAIENTFVDHYLTRDNESVDEAKKRLRRKLQSHS